VNRRDAILGAGALAAAASAVRAQTHGGYPILELRQYTLHGGKRDVLVHLFENYFIDGQEALEGHILGMFHDLDDPDRFVWLRAFKDMDTRGKMEPQFYRHDPQWLAHKAQANPTMLDSDNVLLLHAVGEGMGKSAPGPRRPCVLRADIRQLRDVDPMAYVRFFDAEVAPRIAAHGGRILARYVSETEPNNFPALPVREHESVFVWFARFDDAAAEARFDRAMAALSGWRDKAPDAILPALMRKPEVLRLQPTPRSTFY
jgi:NIPSNAP